MGTAQVIQFANDDLLAGAVAAEWVSAIAETQSRGGKHVVALSGGRVTQKFFASTVQRARESDMAWHGVEFFWADERCVPPTDPASNYLLADEMLFQPAKISPRCVHRILGERNVVEAARLASEELSLIADKRTGVLPILDLVLLGMGEDGHIASLFPGMESPEECPDLPYWPVKNSPKPPAVRVTLGYQPIVSAMEVWVLASGSGKSAALKESLLSNGRTPLARVIQKRCVTKIFTDIAL